MVKGSIEGDRVLEAQISGKGFYGKTIRGFCDGRFEAQGFYDVTIAVFDLRTEPPLE